MITTLELDGVIVPTEAILAFDQQYTDLAGVDFRRLADGAGVVRATWADKLATTITGEGWAPSALEHLALGSVHTLRCAMPRAIGATGTTITLPAARRADAGHEPLGFALVGDALVATTITNLAAILAGSTDDATLAAVAGASGYRVHVWPEVSVVVTANTCRGRSAARYTWSIEAEQV